VDFLDRLIDDSINVKNQIFDPKTYMSLLDTHKLPDAVEKLPHLEDKVRQVFNVYQSLLPGWTEVNLVMGGATGTGKTAVLDFVERSLVRRGLIEVDHISYNSTKPRVIHINCEELTTYTQILQYTIRMFHDEVQMKVAKFLQLKSKIIPERGLSQIDYFMVLKQCMMESRASTLFIFDNFQRMKKNDANQLVIGLKNISQQLKSEYSSEDLKISVIVVLPDLDMISTILDPESLNHFYRQEVRFYPYRSEQIMSILETRLSAFREGAVTLEVLEYISDHVAEMNGCARYALNLLKDSSRLAQEQQKSVVSIEDVEKSIRRYSLKQYVGLISNHSFHHILILLSVYSLSKKENDINTSEIYNEYSDLINQINTHFHERYKLKDYRTITRYLQQLYTSGLLEKSRRTGQYRGGVHVSYALPPKYHKDVIQSALLENRNIVKYNLLL